MTLILSLITSAFTIHASDRRLTDGRTGEQMNTKASKTVIAPQAMFMVSYTGLASLSPPMTTLEWLMRTLWDNRGQDLLEGLARAAGGEIEALRIPKAMKRHAFLVSGWLDRAEWGTEATMPEGFRPGAFVSLVSNFHDFEGTGGELAEPRDHLAHRTRPLYPGDKYHLVSAGARLTDYERQKLDDEVSAALRSPGGGERAAAVAMLHTIQAVADRDPTVGGGAFVSAIPRGYSPPSDSESGPGLRILGMRWGLPEPREATFVHVPDQATESVESPGIIADPFAGYGVLTVRKGRVPDLSGVAEVPEEGQVAMHLVALRSSAEIAERARAQEPDSSGAEANGEPPR